MRLILILGAGVVVYLAYQEWLRRRGIGPDLSHVPGAFGVDVYPESTMLEATEPWELNAQEQFRGF